MSDRTSAIRSKDTAMTENSHSDFIVAMGNSIFDLDFSKHMLASMLDPSHSINPFYPIEFTFLTINFIKKPFFWANSPSGFTGILVSEALPGQVDYMKKKLSQSLMDFDILFLDFYYYYGTKVGLLKEGRFIPYVLVD